MTEVSTDLRQPDVNWSWRGRRLLSLLWANALEACLLGSILILAFGLRTYNLNWDQFQHLHPDERFISSLQHQLHAPASVGDYFDSEHSQLNPYNHSATYVYGTFPLFLNKTIGEWLDRDADGTTHRTGDWARDALDRVGVSTTDKSGNFTFNGGYDGNLVGRFLSALFDTATVLLVFDIGRSTFNRWSGLLAAFLYACAPLQIQSSHYFTVDTFLTFFSAASFCVFVRVIRGAHPALLVLAGALVGMAVACKVSGLLLIVPFGATAAIRWRPAVALEIARIRREGRNALVSARPTASLLAVPGWTVLALATGLGAFRIFQPYAFEGPTVLHTFRWDYSASDFAPGALLHLEPLQPTHYLDLDSRFTSDLSNLRRLQDGSDFPPNAQWVGRGPLLFPLKNLVLWGFGPCASLAAAVGLAFCARRPYRRDPAVLLTAGWIAGMFAYYAPSFVPTMRYFMPAYPLLAVLGGFGLSSLAAVALPRTAIFQGGRRYLPQAVAICLSAGALFWGLAFVNGVYGHEVTRIQASRWMLAEIPDWATISHENWDDGLPMQPPGFPPNPFRTLDLDLFGTDSREKTIGLVDQLDQIDYIVESSNRVSGSIPRTPARYPATTRYYEALEDGTLGFEQVATFSRPPQLFGITLDDSGAEEAFTVYDHPTVRIWRKTAEYSRGNALRVLQPDRADAAIEVIPGKSDTNALQLTPSEYARQQAGGTWADVFDPDGVTSHLPWLWWLLWLEVAAFAALPATTWLLRPLPDRGFGASKVIGPALVAFGAWSLVAWGAFDFSGQLAWTCFAGVAVSGAAVGWIRRSPLRAEVRELWKPWLLTEVVFLVAFAGFLLLRANNPDLWYHPTGGEKPMEVAYLTAVTKSTTMPPYDPWFAGGYLNYYYMGWFFLAVPIRAFHLVPEIAFNLGIPTFAALAAAVTWSTGYNLVAISRARASLPSLVAAVTAVALLLVAGNLDGIHQWVERLQAVSTWDSPDAPVVGGAVSLAGGMWRWSVHGADLAPFDWWRSSRVHFGSNDITEFPYWSMLFGDLHPHVMGIPFFGLTISLGLAYLCLVSQPGARSLSHRLVLAGCLGITVGAIRTIHTWDYPTAAGLALSAVAGGQLLRSGTWQARVRDLVADGLVVAVASQLSFAPYVRDAAVFNAGIIRAPETTPPQQFFDHFGIFLIVGAAFVATRYAEEARRPGRNPVVVLVASPAILALALAGLGLLTYYAQSKDRAVLALGTASVLLLLNLLWIEGRRADRDLGRLVATFLLAGALGVACLVELVTVRDDIVRMNTVFKYSLEAWHLFSLSGAYAAVYVTARMWSLADQMRPPGPARALRVGTVTACSLLIALGLIYPLSATSVRLAARFDDREPTLNGLAYLQADPTFVEDLGPPGPTGEQSLHLREDEPLIQWLRRNVEGSPTIVEAVGPLYHWTGRYSINTGLPAVIGWDWHQIQQRGDFASPIGKRRTEVADFYATKDPASAERFLRRYDVAYVIVGPWERGFGTPAGIAKFETMPALHEVFRSGSNRIYEVDKQALGHDVRPRWSFESVE